MQARPEIKIGIIAVFVLSLVIGGIIMFRGLIYNKQVLESELYAYLPTRVSGVLQINKEKGFDSILPLLDDLSPVISNVKSSVSYPVIVAQMEKNNYFLTKVTQQQETSIKDILDKVIFPDYPPKEKIYKNGKLLLYMVSDNKFFICMFYDGIFIAGYNIRLFEEYIDNREENSKGIIDTPMGKDILNKIKIHYPANLFLNNTTSFSVFNINFEDNGIEMDGFDTHIDNEDWICDENKDTDTLRIDYSLFPDSLIGYSVEMDNPMITDSLKCEFSAPSYSFFINRQSKPVYALKHVKDKFHIYNKLNDMEEVYIGKKFNINDFHSGYRIYTTSTQLGRDIFQVENRMYLVFYKNYMIFSEDKKALAYYLTHNGRFSVKNRFQTDQTVLPLTSVIFTNNITEYHPRFFNPENPFSQNYKKDVYMTSSIKNRKRTYKVYINK